MSDIKSSPARTQKRFTELDIRWQALAILTAFTFLLTILYNAYLDYDVANYLTIGQMLVQGDIPFVNVIDTNPPTIMYISFIPAWVASITGISLLTSALLFFYLLVIASGLLLIVGLKASQPDMGIPQAGFWLTIWIMLSIWIYKVEEFGQREHLIFLFLASFIILRKARYEGKSIPSWAAVLSGFLVCLAITMKPHYAIPLVLVEAYYLIVSRELIRALFAPEVYSLLISCVLYVGHFFVVPGMSDFFTYWIPFLSRGYGAYDSTWWDILAANAMLSITWSSLLIIGILLLNLIFSKKKGLMLENSFLLLILGSLIVFFVQHKGWFYQSLVFHLSSLLGLVFLVNKRLKAYNRQSFLVISSSLQLAILVFNFWILATLYKPIVENQFLRYKETDLTRTIQALSKPKERIFFISDDVYSTFPDITYTERVSAGHFLISFPILFFRSNIPQQPVSAEWLIDEEKYYQTILEDFKKYAPNLVLIEMSDRTIFNYLKYKNFLNTALTDYYCIGQANAHWVFVRSSEFPSMESLKAAIQNLYKQHSIKSIPSCNSSTLEVKK